MIFHIALVDDWKAAQTAGDYRVSTRGRTLAQEGFIHAGRLDQVVLVADSFYADVGPVLLLTIDPDLLTAPVQEDEVAPGVSYPHIYGPINLSAVVDVVPLDKGPDGTYLLPEHLRP